MSEKRNCKILSLSFFLFSLKCVSDFVWLSAVSKLDYFRFCGTVGQSALPHLRPLPLQTPPYLPPFLPCWPQPPENKPGRDSEADLVY